MTDFKIDSDSVQKLADILVSTELTEIEYQTGETKIRVARKISRNIQEFVPAPQMQAPVYRQEAMQAQAHTNTNVEQVATANQEIVKSPMVGTVYLASEPSADNFVEEGHQVSAGQTLLIIEAMKVMNPIKAPCAGIVRKIFVHNSKPVEYHENLILIEKV